MALYHGVVPRKLEIVHCPPAHVAASQQSRPLSPADRQAIRKHDEAQEKKREEKIRKMIRYWEE